MFFKKRIQDCTCFYLGKFSDMLVKTGYDKIISSSKTYTVWAPSDQALQALDPSMSSTDYMRASIIIIPTVP